MPQALPGDTGNPLRGGGTFVLGCPIGETADNQGRARLTSLAADAKEAAHGGAPQTARKDEQIGAGERRVGPTERDVESTADVTTEGREQAEAAGAEGRQCKARPSRVQRVANFAAWAEKVTEGVRAPHSGEPKRKRRWPSSRREVDGATTGDAQGQATTTPLGEAATADVETSVSADGRQSGSGENSLASGTGGIGSSSGDTFVTGNGARSMKSSDSLAIRAIE